MPVSLVMRGCPYYNSSVAVVCLVCHDCVQKFARRPLASKIVLSNNSIKQDCRQEREDVCGSRNLGASCEAFLSASLIVFLLTLFTSSVFKMPLNLNGTQCHSFMFPASASVMQPIMMNDPDLKN